MRKENTKTNTNAVSFGAWGWVLILICILYQMMYSAFAVDGINGYGLGLAEMLSQLSGSEVTSDMLTAVLTPIGIICCLLGVLFTTLVYQKGTKLVATIACIGMAAGVAFMGNITNFTMYVAGLFVTQAFGTCLAFAVHHGFVGAWFPTRKGVVMGWTTMGLPLTSMILVPFVTWCMGGSFGWKGFCYVLAGILVLLAVITFTLLTNTPEEKGCYPDNMKPESQTENTDQEKTDILRYFKSQYTLQSLLKNKSVWMICIGFGIPWATTAGVMSQLIARMMSTGHFANVGGPVAILAGATIVGLMGSFCWGWLDTRIGTKKAGVLYNIAYIIILVVLIFLHRLPAAACTVVTCCLCFTAGGIPNLMPSMVISKFGRYEFLSANRVCTPLATIIQSMGFAVLAVGKMLTGGSWAGGYGVFIVACAIGALVIMKIDDKKESDDQEIEKRLIALAKADHK